MTTNGPTDKYQIKLLQNGLAQKGTVLLGTAGAAAVAWNRSTPAAAALEPVFSNANTRVVLCGRPAEPFATIIDYLARSAVDGVVRPDDSETRVFLTDLPVIDTLEDPHALSVLTDRKCAIVPGFGIVTRARTPAEAYVNFSAACFAGFVKFFSDILISSRSGVIHSGQLEAFNRARGRLPAQAVFEGGLMAGPFESETHVRQAMVQAGREMVARGLVDACFGNISYRLGNTLYISTSGSFLDELENDITPIALNGSGQPTGRPSSELPTHQQIAQSSNFRAVLHGHPLFSVILSMDCRVEDCRSETECHRLCPHEREICGIPIVSGEIGGGPHGLCTTVPNMLKRSRGTIVYGHGVFTCAENDFNHALGRMVAIERICRNAYFEQIGSFIGDIQNGI